MNPKFKQRLTLATILGICALAATSASAQIAVTTTVKAFVNSTKNGFATTDLGTTNATVNTTGVSKLVVVLTGEPGNNNQVLTITGVSFNGVAMTKAVNDNTRVVSTNDCGDVAIYYLDNPAVLTAGTFSFTSSSTGGAINGGIASIIGLSGTITGVGNTAKTSTSSPTAASTPSTSITTTSNSSMVIAAVQNSGAPNAAGTPTATSPLTLIHNGPWGSNTWGSMASARQTVASASTITPTFSTAAGGNIHVIAAEFNAAFAPVVKADNFNNLSVGSSWVGGVVPSGVGTWNSTVTGANTTSLGADLVLQGIKIADPGGLVTINSGNTLTLGAAAVDIDLSSATQDLTVNSSLALAAANVWDVNTGRTLTLGGAVSGSSAVTKQGAGTAVLSGASTTYSGITTISGGSLNLTGSLVNASLGNVAVQAGGTLNASGTVTGSTTTALTYGSTAGTSMVNVSSGANLTLGALTGSNNASAVSIYTQSGGTVNLNAATTTTDTSYVAQLGYGHLNLTGGSIASNSRFSVTFSSAGASGVARIGGGAGAATLSANDLLAIGRTTSATGEMTVLSNGAVTYNGTGANNMLLLGNATNCTGFLNIVGGTFSSPAKGISWGNGTTTNGGLGMLNLGAGTLEIGANAVLNTIASGNNRGYVNLSGGTLKIRSSGITTGLLPVSSTGFGGAGTGGLANTIFGAVTNSTVNLDGSGGASGIFGTVGTTQDFVGGVTINTNGFDSTFTSQLLAPTGNGVAQGNLSITGGSGYVAPPAVRFSNPALGNSTPAAGYALVSGGQVTGIVITSPGDYGIAETPTVTLSGGGGTGASVTIVGTLAANASGGLNKTGTGTLTLSGANTYTGGTVVSDGQLRVSGSGTLAAAGGLSVASSAIFRYLPTTIGTTLTASSLNLANGSTLGLAWDATTANKIAATGAATVGTGTGVALDMGTGFTSGTTYTILTAASGLDVGNYTFLNLTDFTMNVVKMPTSVTITPTTTTALTGAYWRGTATAGLTKIWAATDGNTDSNWSATDGGATQGLVPGVGADVFIPSTAPVVPATSTVLGANMTLKTLTIADTANGMSLNADGSTLTLTPASSTSGIVMSAGVPASSIATPVALGAAQTWTNDSSNALTVNGGISGGFTLNKAGTGTLVLPVANSFSGGLTVKGGTVTLGTTTSAGTGTLTFDNGGLGSATAQYSSASALTVTHPIIVATGSTSTNKLSGSVSAALVFNGAFSIDTGTSLTVENNSPANSSLDFGTGLITGGGSIVTSGSSTGSLIFRGANTYSGGTTLGGSGVHVPATSTTGPAGSPTDGVFGTGTLTIGTVSVRSTTVADTTIGNTLTLAGDLTAITSSSEKNLIFSGPATLTGSRIITSNVGSTVAGKSLTFSGAIGESSSGLGLTKAGTGLLSLTSAASTFTGPVVVSAGILQSNGTGTLANIGTPSSLGSGDATSNATNAASLVLDGGTYSFINSNAPVSTDRLFTLTQNGGTLSADNGTAANVVTFGNTAPIAYTGSGARTLTFGGAHPGGADANFFAPQITNAGADVVSLLKTGTANWALTNTNTYTGATTINGGTLQLGDGTSGNDGTIANSSGVTDNGTLAFNRFGGSSAGYAITGTGAVSKLGAGTQTLTSLSAIAANNYSGTTIVDQGTLAFTTTTPSLTGGLTFGSAAGSTNVGSLDLSNTSATFGGGMVVRNNSASNNVITIGSGQTLTFTGSSVANAISVGSATAGGLAKLQVTGGTGTLTVTDSTRNIVVANTDTTGTSASAQMDLSGLGTFNANIAGLYVGRPTSAAGAAANGRPLDVLTLAGTNTITASGVIAVGGSTQSFVGQATLKLGTTNALNAASFVLGSSRTNGTMQFNTGLTTPAVTIRGAAGASTRTDIYLGDQANSRGVSNGAGGSSTILGKMDFTGGSIDAMIGSLFVGLGGGVTSNLRANGQGTFIMDGASGNVDINTLVIAQNRNDNTASTTNPAGIASTAIFTMINGTLVVNTAATLANDIDTTNTANSQQGLSATFNLQGGTATIGSLSTPTPLILGTQVAAGNAGALTATVNLTGGTLNMFGDIKEGTLGNGTITSSITLDGGTLDMKGNNIGVGGIDTLAFKSGTLKNVAQINNGAGLTKTTSGILTLSGTNTYTGATSVNAGTLALGASNVLPDASPVSIGSASLDAVTFSDTLGTLDAAGAAVINLGSGGTLAFADSSAVDWTGGSLNITGTFVSGSSIRFGTGSSGLTSTQLALISVNGTGTGTYTLDANGYLILPAGFSGYITGTFANGTVPLDKRGPNDDPDNDGISNLLEYAIAGQDPTVANTSISTLIGNVLSFSKRPGTNGLTYSIQESTDLGITDAWQEVGSYTENSAATISCTLTPGTPAAQFFHLQVLSN